jgi:MSHA biogenesis protein MshN
VINAMLRGLDERARRDGRDMELGPAVQVAAREHPSTLKRVSLTAAGGLAGAALAAGLWLYWGGMFQGKPAMVPAAATSASAPSQAAVMPAPIPPDAPAAASEVVALPASSRAERVATAYAGDSNSNGAPAAPIAKALPLSPAPSAQAPASPAVRSAPEPPREVAAAAAARPRTSKTYDAKQLAANALAKSIALGDEGRLEEAKEPLRQVLAVNPGDLAARQMLAQLEIDTGHLDEARGLLEVAVQQHPVQPALAWTLARLRADAGDIAAAIALLDAARAGARDDPQLHALLGALLLRSKRFAEAVDAYVVALRADPANPTWLIGIAVALEATGRTGDALEAYQRADAVAGLTADQAEFVNARLTHLRR